MTDFLCDASEMRTLAAKLLIADKASQTAFYASLEVAGNLVERQAAANIAPYSKKIGKTGQVRRRGSSVRFSFGGGGTAPNAAPFENHGHEGTFRHPVFGNRNVWVSQKAHPYLVKAAHETEAEVIAVVDKAIVTGFRTLGF